MHKLITPLSSLYHRKVYLENEQILRVSDVGMAITFKLTKKPPVDETLAPPPGVDGGCSKKILLQGPALDRCSADCGIRRVAVFSSSFAM